ncbi:hypothetical protein [Halosegnis sp.]|uniref:hypothetical protein n=1 Tax=Halosegnis sp. TaxID=2864959 RepID=UPI0035D417F4
MADDRDPNSVTVALATRPARDLPELDEDGPAPDEPVFTDLYLPETGGSVSAVFGMDLSTPRTQGRFVSHPTGPLALTQEDDLHETVLVAVPPYDRDSLAAFDRRGSRIELTLLDAAPPEVAFEG